MTDMSQELELRHFNIREADWSVDGKLLSKIRRIVFTVEQSVPQEEEWDGQDEDSWHWIATDPEDVPIGTARLLQDGQIGRMAVLAEHRAHGIGAAMLEQAVEKARHLGFESVYLHSQSHALGFYERCGFVAEGDEFVEAGIPHLMMTQALSPPEDNIQRSNALTGELEVDVKPFDTSEVSWVEIANTIKRIRKQVFETELHLDGYQVEDDVDDSAIHWIATNQDDHAVGVIRMIGEGVISQFAVVDDYRTQGMGLSLLELTIQRARRFNLDTIIADVPASQQAFLLHAGFVMNDDQLLRLTLEPEDTEVQRAD